MKHGEELKCFNSMIVRLKEELIVNSSVSSTKFQFYDSPIKRS